jgi:hypothetical protein
MQLAGRKVTVALRDAPLVPTDWGRQLGVPVVVVGLVAAEDERGFHLEPIDILHLNNGTKIEREKDEMPYLGIYVPWTSVSTVALH